MSRSETRPVVLRRSFPASASEVYAAWTTPDIMRHWLAPGPNKVISIDADVSVGGAFAFAPRRPTESSTPSTASTATSSRAGAS